METQQHEADITSARLQARSAANPAALATREPGATPRGGAETAASHPSARQLEAVFASMSDGVIFADGDGRFVEMNAAARRLLALDARPDFMALPLAEQVRLLHVRDALGRPIPVEQAISWGERVLAGEALGDTETGSLTVRALDGRDVALGLAVAPVRDEGASVTGVVWVVRDITEQRRQAQRTYEALAALVAMAELLVSDDPSDVDTAPGRASPQRAPGSAHGATNESAGSVIAQQLAQLARTVMGCRRLDIFEDEPPGTGLRQVAAAGRLAHEQRRRRAWHPAHGQSLLDLVHILPPAQADRFERGESIPIDSALPEFASLPNPFRARSALITPMRLGDRLVGFLALDYGSDAHAFTPDEIALAQGTARMAALVLERHRLLCEREEARASALALRETNRRMDDFLAIATHELRGPVQASLLGMGLAAQRARKLREQVSARDVELHGQLAELQKDVAEAEESVDRLARLIADLLDVSRIQGGQLTLHLRDADLAAIVGEAVARQRVLAPGSVIHLHLPRVGAVPVVADPDRIGQVVANLLGNAVKYTPEDRPVEVRVQERGVRARVSVTDEGPGLPIEEQGRIWDRYHQAAGIRANSGTDTGLGLGLYIAREIVRAHGGRVGVRSSPGKGATFWFTLPLAASQTSQAAQHPR